MDYSVTTIRSINMEYIIGIAIAAAVGYYVYKLKNKPSKKGGDKPEQGRNEQH
jgi:hypothetical protein